MCRRRVRKLLSGHPLLQSIVFVHISAKTSKHMSREGSYGADELRILFGGNVGDGGFVFLGELLAMGLGRYTCPPHLPIPAEHPQHLP